MDNSISLHEIIELLDKDFDNGEDLNDIIDKAFLILDNIIKNNLYTEQAHVITILGTAFSKILTKIDLIETQEMDIKNFINLATLCSIKNKTQSEEVRSRILLHETYQFLTQLKLKIREDELNIPPEVRFIYNHNLSDKTKAKRLIEQAIEEIFQSDLPEKFKKYIVSQLREIIAQLEKNKTSWRIVFSKFATTLGFISSLCTIATTVTPTLEDAYEKIHQSQQTIIDTSINLDNPISKLIYATSPGGGTQRTLPLPLSKKLALE